MKILRKESANGALKFYFLIEILFRYKEDYRKRRKMSSPIKIQMDYNSENRKIARQSL